MYTVYVLRDEKGTFYKGMTSNLERRILEHRKGKTVTTRKMSKVAIVYTENFETKELARKREVYFKTCAGRRFLKKNIGSRPPIGMFG